MTPAFRSSHRFKQNCLARLRQEATTGSEMAADFLATAAGVDDAAVAAAAIGLPDPVALMAARVVANLSDAEDDDTSGQRARALTAAEAVLAAIAPGADLRAAAGGMVLRLLDRMAADGGSLPSAAPLLPLLAEVQALHRRMLAGDAVERRDWSSLRTRALAATDAVGPDPARWLGSAIEAAAWPPTSKVLLTDLLLPLRETTITRATREAGWTEDDGRAAMAMLQGIYDETQPRRDAGEDVQIPSIFRERAPELQARFVEHLAVGRQAVIALYLDVLSWLGQELADLGRRPRPAPAIIARANLFGNPARTGSQISPNGRWLSWHAPLDGVMNVWVAPRDRPDEARALTRDTHRGITGHSWSYDNRHILYEQDRDGDERTLVYTLDVESGTVRALTETPGPLYMIAQLGRRHPGTVLIASNERDPRFHDLYRYEIATGERVLVEQNDGFGYYITDEDFRPVLAVRSGLDGAREFCRRDAGAWATWLTLGVDDADSSGPISTDPKGTMLYFADSRGREAAALTVIDIATGEQRVLAEDPRGPVGAALLDMESFAPLAWSINVERREVFVLDDSIAADVARFAAMGWADWSVVSRTLDDRWWVVGTSSDVAPGVAWLYDRDSGELTRLGEGRPALTDAPLSRMYPFTIRSRDGLPLVCYLTLPIEADDTGDAALPRALMQLPMVLEVHGGPAMRDTFGFNPWHQWMANRGYAVLSVNFRGSSGFSKSFLAAGDGEWGARMSDDLDDAVAWAIERGIADPERIAISGASYGGYAVLAALTRTPEAFACGIDLVGPSNLETLMEAIPPYWEQHRATLYRKVGDPATDAGRALMRDRSPLHRAASIARPLLIGQGANDPRVLKQEADQMAAAMTANGVPVTYLLYPDEGHGFGRPANAVSFSGVSEAFLARHLGGRCETLTAAEMVGAKMEVIASEAWLENVLP